MVRGGKGVPVRTPRPWLLPPRPVPLADLLVPGVTRAMVATQVKAGRLLRLRDGVFVAAQAWPEDNAGQHVLLARAEQVANPAGVISHHSAGLVWGLPSPPLANWLELPPTLTSPRGGGQRCRRSAHARWVEAELPDHHVTRDQEGWSVTTVARTAVDLARGPDLPAALVVLDAAARAMCAGMISRPRRSDYANPALLQPIRASFEDARAGRRGLGAALKGIELADPLRESPIESLTAAHLVLAGLPMPEFQEPIQTRLGIFYPDCLWREQGLIGEADGAEKYSDTNANIREKEREQALRDLGFRMVRWLGKEITYHPDIVMARIARQLAP